jgi:hypothetical protein
LSQSETNWEEVYLVIRGSYIGADFPAERFLRTPVSTIRELLSDIDFRAKYDSNVASVTAAQGVHYLIQYLHRQVYGDKDVPDAPPKSFLPFPELKHPSEGKDEETGPLKASTKKIIERLASTGRIPIKIKDALLKVPPSLNER